VLSIILRRCVPFDSLRRSGRSLEIASFSRRAVVLKRIFRCTSSTPNPHLLSAFVERSSLSTRSVDPPPPSFEPVSSQRPSPRKPRGFQYPSFWDFRLKLFNYLREFYVVWLREMGCVLRNGRCGLVLRVGAFFVRKGFRVKL